MLMKQLFLCMVVREHVSGLQNEVKFHIQKHSSSQKGCDSQLDKKNLLHYLAGKCSCACLSCEGTAVPGAGKWVTKLCDSKSPPLFSPVTLCRGDSFHPNTSYSVLAGFIYNKLLPRTLQWFFSYNYRMS